MEFFSFLNHLPGLQSSSILILLFAYSYIGYWLAYHGYDDKVSAGNKFYKMLPFFLLNFITLQICLHITKNSILFYIAALVVSIVGGIFWRKCGKDWLFKFLNKTHISNENMKGSVLQTITQDTSLKWSRINVKLQDGTWLYCKNLGAITKDTPFAPMRSDNEGNIAMYVTHIKEPGKKDKIELEPLNILLYSKDGELLELDDPQQKEGSKDKKSPGLEYELTYIPKSSIQFFDITIEKK